MISLKRVGRAASWLFEPVRQNATFFVFMYALGLVCAWATLPETQNAHLYKHLWAELLVDVYALCTVLLVLPPRLRRWVRAVLCVVAYALALADVFCFVRFDSTLTPTMLLLVGETNGREAGEFLRSYLSADLLCSRVGWVLALMGLHAAWTVACRRRIFGTGRSIVTAPWRPAAGVLTAVAVGVAMAQCWPNKVAFCRLMGYDTIGEVEHELTKKDERAQLYQPAYRLAFSLQANRLAARQADRLMETLPTAQVDSCAFSVPQLVLIIGESYNRRHSQLYGYDHATTPRQAERAKRGELQVFDDVVAPWNLTSFVFKHVFSLYCVGDSGDWCDHPLFPVLFRRAGYRVCFLTNQFLPQAKEAVYDFSGGFFLNHPELSQAMFDTRNERLYYFDDGMLREFDRVQQAPADHQLTIVHLKGQHVDYRTRCPRSRQYFTKADYRRPRLSAKELQELVYYDNSLRYNDSIVDQLVRRMEDRNAVVIYMPDHGEEVYNDDVHLMGRLHSAEVDGRLAREEFAIPFWIWCSHDFMVSQPELYGRLIRARHRPFMTDALPHLLLSLAGIRTPAYRDSLDLLSDDYDEHRPRRLKHGVDYNVLRDQRN